MGTNKPTFIPRKVLWLILNMPQHNQEVFTKIVFQMTAKIHRGIVSIRVQQVKTMLKQVLFCQCFTSWSHEGNKRNFAHGKKKKNWTQNSEVVTNGKLIPSLWTFQKGRQNLKYPVLFLTCLCMTPCYSLKQKSKHLNKIWT